MSSQTVESNRALAEAVGESPTKPLPHLWTSLSDQATTCSKNHPAIKSINQPIPFEHDNANLTGDIVWSYSELYSRSERLAARFSNLGIRKGDSVAAFLDNRAEYALLFWASIRLDAVFVPLNPRIISAEKELQHVLRVVTPRVLVVIDGSSVRELENIAADLIGKVKIRIVLDRIDQCLANEWITMKSLVSDSDIAKAATQQGLPSPINDLDQTMVIVFTSGTTSLPKASISTYGNVLASAGAFEGWRHLDHESSFLQHLPVFHAWSIYVTWALWTSGATVVYPSRTFDARASLDAIGRERCTHMCAVPSMIQALVAHPSLPDAKLDSLQSIDLAGTMIPPEIIEACMNELKAQYSSVLYGMTEGSAICGLDIYEAPSTRHNIPQVVSCGKVAPGARLRVCRPDSKIVLQRGATGELHMGGLQVTKGYLDRPSKDFYQENDINWLVTGDQARTDEEGFVYILGRYKDLIIRGGENISPTAIERCIDTIEGIKDSQVVGLPDEIAGEVPVAVIRRSTIPGPTKYQIQQRVSKTLGRMFSPQYILDLNEIGLTEYPRTTSGKIKKGDLKDHVSQHLSRGREQGRDSDQHRPTVEILIALWARLSGREAHSISLEECADTFADSIMMMQFCNLVGKELDKTIAVDEIMGDTSIEEQAQMIDDRSTIKRPNTSAVRSGPPTAADMVHVNGDLDAASRCQRKVEALLQPHGLDWEDVEDVIPTSQTAALMTRRTRLRNWNRRHAYLAPNASIADLHRAITMCLQVHPILRSMILAHGEALPLYVVVRSSDRWHQLAISTGHTVDIAEDLKTIHFESDDLDFAIPPGPLFRFMLFNIRNEDSAGLVISCHHSTFDALSMGLFFEDLDMALSMRRQPKPHASFKQFADRKYGFRESVNADEAVAWHIKRLKGYAKHRNGQWLSYTLQSTLRFGRDATNASGQQSWALIRRLASVSCHGP
ncbi:MAG: hypothetical protein Q9174_005905 [Haloplaca sp. 1 TL-2023]